MSASTPTLEYGSGSYDFTTGPPVIYGGSAACSELAPGTWGMAAGDLNANGYIDNLDKAQQWAPAVGLTGYLQSDANLDGQVQNQDKNDCIIRNLGKLAGVPQ